MSEESALTEYVQSTSLYKTHAKAITAAVAGLVNVAWFLTVLPTDLLPPGVAIGVALGVQFIGGVVGVAAVPNSLTNKQLSQVQDYAAKPPRKL